MFTFSLLGAAGYVASRHMKAIRDTGNTLVSVFDPCENLGILDQYFPEARSFSDFREFSAFHDLQGRNSINDCVNRLDIPVDYLSICSPNQVHFDQICWGLRHQAHIICEKPLVTDPGQLDILQALERESGRKVNTILQLRLLPVVIKLKNDGALQNQGKKLDVSIEYITARGNWYFNSWKGKEELSGGIVTNIGIHLFDLLIWLFGDVEEVILEEYTLQKARGSLELERASVRWTLSIDGSELPGEIKTAGKRSYRHMLINGQSYPLDEGMENLHTLCYREILAGNGPGISDAAPSIKLCHSIRLLNK